MNKITASLQQAFNRIQTWLESLGLDISLTKTQFMICHRSNSRLVPINQDVFPPIFNSEIFRYGLGFEAQVVGPY